jgi:hypothetical protein
MRENRYNIGVYSAFASFGVTSRVHSPPSQLASARLAVV